MARSLNGSSDRIDVGDVAASEGVSKFSIGGWANFASLNNYGGIVQKSGSYTMNLAGNFDQGSDDFYVAVNSGERQMSTSANILATNRWDHYLLVFDGTQATNTDRLAFYFNGVSQSLTQIGAGGAIGSTINATTNNLKFGLGKDFASAVRVAEWGAWLDALDAAAARSLAAKYAPPFIRPGSLEAYWDFRSNNTVERDFFGPNVGSYTGTTLYAHPPVITPKWRGLPKTGTSPPPPPPSTYIGARYQMIGAQQFSGGRAA